MQTYEMAVLVVLDISPLVQERSPEPHFWGHWYSCFRLLVTSPLGFKARVGNLIHTWQRHTWYTVPEIHLYCDTYACVYGQHSGWLFSPHMTSSHICGISDQPLCWQIHRCHNRGESAKQEVCSLNPASYLCWNTHSTYMWRKQPTAMLAIYTYIGVTIEVNLTEVQIQHPTSAVCVSAEIGCWIWTADLLLCSQRC